MDNDVGVDLAWVMTQDIDPNVELLSDIPISSAEEDLFRGHLLAIRLTELVTAAPAVVPRVVALTGPCGAGKSSILNMVSAMVAARPDVATVAIDAQEHASAEALLASLASELEKVFSDLGVVEERDKVRAAVVSYGGLVSGLVRLAGMKVDVSGVLARSAAALRDDISRNLEQAGKRLVIVVDHLDYLPSAELDGAFAALRMYGTIPYIGLVLAVDRHGLATRPGPAAVDPRVFERLVHVELAMPPSDRTVLARVMAGGLERVATRSRRDFDQALRLFDPEGGVGLGLIETPRDAKRACNALTAALPLLPVDADPFRASLEVVLTVLVPESAVPLAMRAQGTQSADRATLFARLADSLAQHPRAIAIRAALRALLVDE